MNNNSKQKNQSFCIIQASMASAFMLPFMLQYFLVRYLGRAYLFVNVLSLPSEATWGQQGSCSLEDYFGYSRQGNAQAWPRLWREGCYDRQRHWARQTLVWPCNTTLAFSCHCRAMLGKWPCADSDWIPQMFIENVVARNTQQVQLLDLGNPGTSLHTEERLPNRRPQLLPNRFLMILGSSLRHPRWSLD